MSKPSPKQAGPRSNQGWSGQGIPKALTMDWEAIYIMYSSQSTREDSSHSIQEKKKKENQPTTKDKKNTPNGYM